MRKLNLLALAALSLLLRNTTTFARDVYYPYQSYDDYYKAHSVEPPPVQKPAATQPPPPTEVKPRVRPEQPVTLLEPPGFLFPAELGFGVAIGVPYDLFYYAKAYYLVKYGTWYRATTYRGPWMVIPANRVPPELRKHKLAEVRQIRNREFEKYWKDKAHYQGKYYRPSEEGEADQKGLHR